MCLLSYYPPGVAADTDALLNGAHFNNDGHGFAVVTDKRIIVRHGMDPEVMIATFDRVRGQHPHGPALFHSRFGTHGTVGRHNCHPFRLGGDRRSVLAHNGILPRLVQPAKGDRRCDTRVAAEDFLPGDPFGHLDDPATHDRFAAWLGPSNKLVILTVNPAYQRRSYLINAQHGTWDGGAWYSNDDYLTPVTHDRLGYGTGFGTALDVAPEWAWPDDATRRPCWSCGVPDSITPEVGYCAVCGACDDCGEPHGHCRCYPPSWARARTG